MDKVFAASVVDVVFLAVFFSMLGASMNDRGNHVNDIIYVSVYILSLACIVFMADILLAG